MKLRRALAITALFLLSLAAWLLFSSRARSWLWPRPMALTIRFWNGFTGPDGRTMLKIVRQFNRENPDVEVLMQRMDWGTYYNKLFVASVGHRAPEVFVVHASSLPRFARADLLQPLDALVQGESPPSGRFPAHLSSTALPVSDFDPNVWQAMQYGGQTVAIPLDIHPLGMFYNAKLLREAGFARPDGTVRLPADRGEFLAFIKRLTFRRPDGVQQWGFVFTTYRTNLMALMAQFGGKLVSDDGRRCLLDQPPNVAALDFCADLIHRGLAPRPENLDAWIGFRQGKVALAFEGIYLLSDLEKQPELDFGGAPLPVLGKEPATWADSHGLCLRANLKGPKRAAAWRFIKFLSDHSLEWARAGQIPVRISQRNTPEFRAMRVQSRFAEQIPYAHYSPRVPFIFEFFSEFDLAVERAMRGTLSPSAALRIATERIDNAIERDRKENARAAQR